MNLFFAQAVLPDVTNLITGGVADGYVHQWEWWAAGFFVGLFLGVINAGIRLLRWARGRNPVEPGV